LTEKVALPELPRILRAQYDVTATYYQVWTAATNGRIPAVKAGNRLYVWRDQLPAVAAEMAGKSRSKA